MHFLIIKKIKLHEKIALYTLIILFAFSCKKPIVNVKIDNPTNKILLVKFDDMEQIEIHPYQTKKLYLESGKRNIIVNSSKEEKIEFNSELEYLINPLKETYYIETRK